MALQLELGIKPTIKYSFENYVVSEHNTQAVSHLKYMVANIESTYIYLWGATRVGKSHLLHAVSEYAVKYELSATYFSFENIEAVTPDLLDSLEAYDIICLDDIQYIAGNKLWEEALFGLYNLIKDANKILIITSNCAVANLNIKLADLKSRLVSGISYHLKFLSDEDKVKLLQINANERGMTLSSELAQFLISRGSRDIAGLFIMLDKLDEASLRYKRKLTIPFVKSVLGI
jgi:DnaA family protein